MAPCRGLCSPGSMKYAASTISTRMSGFSQVCLKEMRFHRVNRLFAFLRLECDRPFSLAFRDEEVEGGDEGCRWERFDVAIACAPVSPRGSPPRLELLRRRRVALALASEGDMLDDCGRRGNGSVEDDMV